MNAMCLDERPLFFNGRSIRHVQQSARVCRLAIANTRLRFPVDPEIERDVGSGVTPLTHPNHPLIGRRTPSSVKQWMSWSSFDHAASGVRLSARA
jgi:hypothetical protein